MAEHDVTCNPVRYEQCDGADLRGATCASLGYFGGVLACTGCEPDVFACQPCAPLDANLLGCEPDAASGILLALAATDSEIAVISADRQANTYSFQRFAPDLSPLGSPLDLTASFGDVRGPADLIATPTGWLLASFGESLKTQTLDPSGHVTSTLTVAAGDGEEVRLVARPGGGAFLLWRIGDGVSDNADYSNPDSTLYVATLPENNSTHSEALEVGTIWYNRLAATALGDKLLIAGKLDYQRDELETVLVNADATSHGEPTPIPGSLSPVGVAPAPDGASLVFLDHDQAHLIRVVLDASGAIIAGPEAVAPASLNFAGMLALGDTTILAGRSPFTLTALSSTGATVGAPHVIAKFGPGRLARMGDTVIAAWSEGAALAHKNLIALARFAPPTQ